jgi:hypothetical protein
MGERYSKIWKCEVKGRDLGKRFLITEMPAAKGEAWAYRALLALIGNNAQLPDGFEKTGMAGLAQIGFRGLMGLPWFTVQPLLDELMECIQIITEPKTNFARALQDDANDIEEIATRMVLKWEVFKLHVDFSEAGVQSLIERVKAMAGQRKNTETGSPA